MTCGGSYIVGVADGDVLRPVVVGITGVLPDVDVVGICFTIGLALGLAAGSICVHLPISCPTPPSGIEGIY